MKDAYNIILSGVGGQGLMLLSSVFGEVCAKTGTHIVTGEQHGLSQRSGSISVHLRIGADALSPLIPYGEADLAIAMEATEALRYLEYLREGAPIVMSSRVIHPPLETAAIVDAGAADHDYFTLADIMERLRGVTTSIVALDALALAEKAGTARAENVVLLGAACGVKGFPLKADDAREAVERIVPPKTVEANRAAFDMGFDACCAAFEE